MINTSDFNLQFGIQSARGIYPTNPTYKAQVVGKSSIKINPNLAKLNVGDAGMFTPSFKRVNRFEPGGQVPLLAQPLDVGALMYMGWGGLADSGGADPYTHTITPATSMSDYVYATVWQYIAGRWVRFHDVMVTAIDLTVANDANEGFMLVTPTFVGMAKPEYVAAPSSPATAESDAYHWLDGPGYYCIDGDWDNLSHLAMPTDLDTLKTWLTNYKALWNLHCAVATGRHHQAADATNTLSYATPPLDLAACIAALTEIKTDFEAHRINTTVHYFADTTNAMSYTTPVADLAAALLAVQEIQGFVNSPGDYNAHLGAVASLKSLTLSFNPNAATIQGEDITPYAVQRKRGVISVAAEMLVEDLRLINKVQFGDIAPTAGDEATSEIQLGSLVSKHTASTSGNERSLKVSVPQFDYDPTGFDLEGDAEGNEAYITVGGEASGTAPIATVTVKNSVATY